MKRSNRKAQSAFLQLNTYPEGSHFCLTISVDRLRDMKENRSELDMNSSFFIISSSSSNQNENQGAEKKTE